MPGQNISEQVTKLSNKPGHETVKYLLYNVLKEQLGATDDEIDLDVKTWKKAEKLLIEAGILKQGGLMQDVREIIREKGRWEGERIGLRKGRQEVVLNMLKKKADISFISEVTGFSEKEIKKLKNGS